MHGAKRGAAKNPARTPSGAKAIVWIGDGRALVVRDAGDRVDQAVVTLPVVPGATPPALADVAHRIGTVDRVVIMGAEDLRTALEREIVAIGHAPDTIREAVLEGPVEPEVLLAHLRRLA